MTLFGLLNLVKHHLKAVIIIPVVCMLIAGVNAFLSQPIYSSRATFITDGDLSYCRGLADIEANSYAIPDDVLSIEVDSSEDSMQVFVYVSDFDSNHCMQVANDVVNATVASFRTVDAASNVQVNEATSTVEEKQSIPKGLAAGLLVGIVLAACYLVLVDLIREPIKSREDVQNAADLPVLGCVLDGNIDEQLFINLQFRCAKDTKSIAIVPLAAANIASAVACELVACFKKKGTNVESEKVPASTEDLVLRSNEDILTVYCCEPISEGMGAAVTAHTADATILCVSEWTDSRRQLRSTINELDLANANLVGMVYVPEHK